MPMSPRLRPLTLLAVALAATAALPGSEAAERRASCGDFTVDTCIVETNGVLETVKDVDAENCQNYCSLIYEKECKFFVYDRKQQLCHLMRQPQPKFEKTCRKLGGPRKPKLMSCADDKGSRMKRGNATAVSRGNATANASKEEEDDPCRPFVEGYCRYHGSLLEHLERLDSARRCQRSCILLQQCSYFLYDEDLMDCQLFDSEERECDIMLGPREPSYEKCKKRRLKDRPTSEKKKKQQQEAAAGKGSGSGKGEKKNLKAIQEEITRTKKEIEKERAAPKGSGIGSGEAPSSKLDEITEYTRRGSGKGKAGEGKYEMSEEMSDEEDGGEDRDDDEEDDDDEDGEVDSFLFSKGGGAKLSPPPGEAKSTTSAGKRMVSVHRDAETVTVGAAATPAKAAKAKQAASATDPQHVGVIIERLPPGAKGFDYEGEDVEEEFGYADAVHTTKMRLLYDK